MKIPKESGASLLTLQNVIKLCAGENEQKFEKQLHSLFYFLSISAGTKPK